MRTVIALLPRLPKEPVPPNLLEKLRPQFRERRVCNQSVGLVQRVLDEEGLSTISLTTIASITHQIKPSHALLVEHPFGLVMSDVNNRERQMAVLREMLAAAERAVPSGTIEALPFEWTKDDLRSRQLRKETH